MAQPQKQRTCVGGDICRNVQNLRKAVGVWRLGTQPSHKAASGNCRQNQNIKGGVDGRRFFCTQLHSLKNVWRRDITHCGGDHALLRVGEMDIFGMFLGLGLGLISGQKKRGLPSPRAEAGQGNI